MNNFVLQVIRKAFLLLAVFLSFAVFDLPSGSALQLFAYHLFVVAMSSFALKVYGANFSVYRAQIGFLFLASMLVLAYSFVDPKVALIVFFILALSVLNGVILSRIAILNPLDFRWAIDLVLAIHVLALIFQFLLYHFIGQSIDLHTLVFPFSESQHGELKHIEVFRLTGLYNEPGTYSTWVACLLFISAIMHRSPHSLHYVVLFTLLLPFSATGYVYFVFILFVFWLSRLGSNSLLRQMVVALVFLVVLVSAAIWLGIDQYIYWRFFDVSVIDGTSGLKLISFEFLLGADLERLVLGGGFAVNDCFSCESIQDVGLYFNLFFQFGLLSIFLVYFMSKVIGGVSLLPTSLLIALLISKMFIFSAALWLAVIVVGALRRNGDVS